MHAWEIVANELFVRGREALRDAGYVFGREGREGKVFDGLRLDTPVSTEQSLPNSHEPVEVVLCQKGPEPPQHLDRASAGPDAVLMVGSVDGGCAEANGVPEVVDRVTTGERRRRVEAGLESLRKLLPPRGEPPQVVEIGLTFELPFEPLGERDPDHPYPDAVGIGRLQALPLRAHVPYDP